MSFEAKGNKATYRFPCCASAAQHPSLPRPVLYPPHTEGLATRCFALAQIETGACTPAARE